MLSVLKLSLQGGGALRSDEAISKLMDEKFVYFLISDHSKLLFGKCIP